MRKFRGWSKDRNKYISPDEINQLFLRMDGRVFWYAYDGFEDVTDKIDIEFATTMFDMKRTEEFPEGQEIYVGDIARQEDGSRHLIIERSNGNFVKKLIKRKEHIYRPTQLDDIDSYPIEIIGNIKQNRNLLG